MRRRLSTHAKEANVDLTPMLDVVFILLIFFIVTSTFIQEKALGAEPPPPQSSGEPSPAITIFVDENNLIRVNGDAVDLLRVRSNLERLRAENPDAPLIIAAHPAARTGTIVLLRDQVYSAKIERVNIVRTTS